MVINRTIYLPMQGSAWVFKKVTTIIKSLNGELQFIGIYNKHVTSNIHTNIHPLAHKHNLSVIILHGRQTRNAHNQTVPGLKTLVNFIHLCIFKIFPFNIQVD